MIIKLDTLINLPKVLDTEPNLTAVIQVTRSSQHSLAPPSPVPR